MTSNNASPSARPIIALSIQRGMGSEGGGGGGGGEGGGWDDGRGREVGGAVDEEGSGIGEGFGDFALSGSIFFSISSRNPNLSSSGTGSCRWVLASPCVSSLAASSFKMSWLRLPPHALHVQSRLSSASFFRSPSPISMPPTCPLAPPSIKALKAHSAVRIPHAGCQVSSWCPLMLRQISRLTSNLPDGVRKRNEGGRRG